MPFALLFIGAIVLITAVRGTYSQLGMQLKDDMTGSGAAGGFLIWIAAIAAVGFLGYSPVLRTPSRLLIALIFLAMLLSNKGFFAQLKSTLSAAPKTISEPASQDPALTGAIPVQLQGGQGQSGGSGIFGKILGGVAQAGAAYATGGASLAAEAAAGTGGLY